MYEYIKKFFLKFFFPFLLKVFKIKDIHLKEFQIQKIVYVYFYSIKGLPDMFEQNNNFSFIIFNIQSYFLLFSYLQSYKFFFKLSNNNLKSRLS